MSTGVLAAPATAGLALVAGKLEESKEESEMERKRTEGWYSTSNERKGGGGKECSRHVCNRYFGPRVPLPVVIMPQHTAFNLPIGLS